MSTRMQQRRGLAAEWAAANTVLADGEIGIEKDTGVIKVGDGQTAWNTLEPVLADTYATKTELAQAGGSGAGATTKYQAAAGQPYVAGGNFYVGKDLPPAPFPDGSLFFREKVTP